MCGVGCVHGAWRYSTHCSAAAAGGEGGRCPLRCWYLRARRPTARLAGCVRRVQVDMKVLSGGFDEGADINEFEHWNS